MITMKKLIFLAVFLAGITSLNAQILNPLRSKDWDAIALLDYKANGKGKMAPVYPPTLKALNNKLVILPGYLIPIKASFTHSTFMLSVLPLEQCGFCGTGNLPIMIETFVTKAVPYTDKPIKVRGTLVLNISETPGKSEITLMNAQVID
jgi:hypothetical protein